MAEDKNPEKGDLIEISREGYQHWALYVGDGDVIHLVKESEHARAGSIREKIVGQDKATVKREKLEDVVGQDEYRINNHLNHKYKPRPIEEIVEDAKNRLGKKLPYNLVANNCEHFATLLRYGTPCSQQVRTVYEAALIAAATIFGILAIAALILKN